MEHLVGRRPRRADAASVRKTIGSPLDPGQRDAGSRRPEFPSTKQNHALEIPMKAPNSHTLFLAAAIALGAILAVAGAAFAFGHQGTTAPAPTQSPYSVPF
jgi:hypothetical protein